VRVVKPKPPTGSASASGPQDGTSPGLRSALEAAGVTAAELFGWASHAHRRVEALSATHVSFDFGGRAVALPRSLLPPVKVNQWVKFSPVGPTVRAVVDLPATLRAEARMVDLFLTLNARCERSPSR
jgi:hypothetical protein